MGLRLQQQQQKFMGVYISDTLFKADATRELRGQRKLSCNQNITFLLTQNCKTQFRHYSLSF